MILFAKPSTSEAYPHLLPLSSKLFPSSSSLASSTQDSIPDGSARPCYSQRLSHSAVLAAYSPVPMPSGGFFTYDAGLVSNGYSFVEFMLIYGYLNTLRLGNRSDQRPNSPVEGILMMTRLSMATPIPNITAVNSRCPPITA